MGVGSSPLLLAALIAHYSVALCTLDLGALDLGALDLGVEPLLNCTGI
jgi:hypothetical protein